MDKVIKVTWKQLEDDGYPSVTDFCRYLVSTGGKFEGIRIEVYRDEMLCMTVHDIYKAAKLVPMGDHFAKYRSKEDKYRSRSSAKTPRSDLNEHPATIPA